LAILEINRGANLIPNFDVTLNTEWNLNYNQRIEFLLILNFST